MSLVRFPVTPHKTLVDAFYEGFSVYRNDEMFLLLLEFEIKFGDFSSLKQ